MADNLDRYYQTLGLRPGASPKEIRQAYLDLTKVWHPDRFTDDPHLKKKAEEQLREINSAYEHLRAAHQARAAKREAERRKEAAARTTPVAATGTSTVAAADAAIGAVLARLPMPEIMSALILVGVLAVLAVVAVACHQLTSSPAAMLAGGLF